ncbi:MAG: hypothetical protein V3T62_09970, partial [Alphaproteobacteria bacterium]
RGSTPLRSTIPPPHHLNHYVQQATYWLNLEFTVQSRIHDERQAAYPKLSRIRFVPNYRFALNIAPPIFKLKPQSGA